MKRPTKIPEHLRSCLHGNYRGDWFAVDERQLSIVRSGDGHVVDIALSQLLKVLDQAGILRRWDRKQQVLK